MYKKTQTAITSLDAENNMMFSFFFKQKLVYFPYCFFSFGVIILLAKTKQRKVIHTSLLIRP